MLEYAWSADGSRIAYRARQDTAGVTELYMSSPDGGVNEKVSGPLAIDGDVFVFSWSR